MEREDGVAGGTTRGLIRQTDEEKLLVELRRLKAVALAERAENERRAEIARQREDLAELERDCARCFVKLCVRFFGITEKQLGTFNEEKLTALFPLIEKRARRVAFQQKAFVALTPIVGWAIALSIFLPPEMGPGPGFKSWHYLWLLGKLRKMYGEDYMPREPLKKLLA